jgi:hypothetical protein
MKGSLYRRKKGAAKHFAVALENIRERFSPTGTVWAQQAEYIPIRYMALIDKQWKRINHLTGDNIRISPSNVQEVVS